MNRRCDDRSVDIFVSRERPADKVNRIKPNPDEGRFTLLRLYGPLEPILGKSWLWNDFDGVEYVHHEHRTGTISCFGFS